MNRQDGIGFDGAQENKPVSLKKEIRLCQAVKPFASVTSAPTTASRGSGFISDPRVPSPSTPVPTLNVSWSETLSEAGLVERIAHILRGAIIYLFSVAKHDFHFSFFHSSYSKGEEILHSFILNEVDRTSLA